MKAFYYVRRFGYNLLPDFFFRWNYKRLKRFEQGCNQDEIAIRLNYYFKISSNFDVPDVAQAVKDFRRTRGTDYYLDLKDFLHYFSPNARFAYQFGDDTHINPYPTLFKARPIHGNNANSILFKLNKNRHFNWVDDPYSFTQKKDIMVWRGGAYKKLRRDFVEKLWNHPLCDVGQTNNPKEDVPWQKGYLSVKEQLKNKFIFCPEGNDVATNLKWAMSSNSLCFMPQPKYETWFMEGRLVPGEHYVEINGDCSDLEDKISFYSIHVNEAENIIKNAHQYIKQFKNKDFEDLLCLKILERYIELSSQKNVEKFV